ncbi:MAG: hypothetical protein KGL39_25075 [Patescibacteria group bacterium]|nr:hypothetical protein [Patescibacteria group bacterium]
MVEVSRDEFVSTIQRLDRADAELTRSMVEIERVLRADYEGKISAAVVSMQTLIQAETQDIKARLSWQNKAWLVPAISTIMLGLLYVALHFLHVS